MVLVLLLHAVSFPLVGQSQFGSNILYFALVVINEGTITSFTIHNPSSTETAIVDVQLYSRNGAPLTSRQVQIVPEGTETVSFGGAGGVLTTGAAELTSSTEILALGFLQLSTVDPRVGMLPSIPSNEIRVLGFVKDDFKSGLSVYQPQQDGCH